MRFLRASDKRRTVLISDAIAICTGARQETSSPTRRPPTFQPDVQIRQSIAFFYLPRAFLTWRNGQTNLKSDGGLRDVEEQAH
jgi:hypothetical protein